MSHLRKWSGIFCRQIGHFSLSPDPFITHLLRKNFHCMRPKVNSKILTSCTCYRSSAGIPGGFLAHQSPSGPCKWSTLLGSPDSVIIMKAEKLELGKQAYLLAWLNSSHRVLCPSSWGKGQDRASQSCSCATLIDTSTSSSTYCTSISSMSCSKQSPIDYGSLIDTNSNKEFQN